MEKKNVAKRVRNGIALILALVSVFMVSSCKKDAQIAPANSPVITSNSNRSTGVANSPAGSNYKVTQPISLNGVHDITISGDSISGGSVSCISLVNCYNIHITHCKLVNSSVIGVNLAGCANIVVDDCYVANVALGVYALNSRGIQVSNNKMKNIQGPQPGGTMVQFDNSSDDAKDAISNSATNNQQAQ